MPKNVTITIMSVLAGFAAGIAGAFTAAAVRARLDKHAEAAYRDGVAVGSTSPRLRAVR